MAEDSLNRLYKLGQTKGSQQRMLMKHLEVSTVGGHYHP